MNNQKVIEYNKFFTNLSNEQYKNKNFSYFIYKCLSKLTQEIEIIQSTLTYPEPENYQEYISERQEINNKYKDGDYKENGSFMIKADQIDNYKDEIKLLEEKYKDVVESIKSRDDEINKFLEKESELELPRINFEDIPEEINMTELLIELTDNLPE